MSRLADARRQFVDALAALERALAQPIDAERIVVDGAIQRFEFTFELRRIS